MCDTCSRITPTSRIRRRSRASSRRRRALDVLIAAAVAALVVAVAVDSLRGGSRTSEQRPPTDTRATTPREELVAALREAGLSGTLVYTDVACELHARRLPDLRAVAPPAEFGENCTFELESDGTSVAPGGAAWSSDGRWALCSFGTTEVHGHLDLRPGTRVRGCTPAWRPTSPPALTVVRDGAVVQVDPACQEPAPGCAREILSRRDLRVAAAQHPNVPLSLEAIEDVGVVDMEWLAPSRAMLLLRLTIDRIGRRDLLVIVDDRATRGSYAFFDTDRDRLEASRTGRLLWAGGGFAVLRGGPRVTVPEAFGPVHAATWSPDERWLALAARDAIALVRPRELGGPRTLLVPLRVDDVAWSPR